MSDVHNEQQSLIRTPKQLVIAVAGFFLVVVIGIILLVTFVTNKPLVGAGSEGQSTAAIAARVRPIAEEGFTLKDMNAPKVLQSGQAVFTAVLRCLPCNRRRRRPQGRRIMPPGHRALRKVMTPWCNTPVQGIRLMPAKGGNPDLDDIEVARAVAYLANQAGAKFKEPESPAPATPAPASAPAAASASTTPAPATTAAAIAPAPVTSTATPAAAAIPVASADAGKTLYAGVCIACHGAGIAGAPKFGDKAAWAARIAQGQNVLYEHAIKGFQGKAGVMPPKGGSAATDIDVKAAVDYIIAAAK